MSPPVIPATPATTDLCDAHKDDPGLRVLRTRPDGYHDLESVLLPIPLHDVLEAVVDPAVPSGQVSFLRSGLAVPGASEEDLCLKAMKLLGAGRTLPGLRMQLHKAIPAGAGLGGGSSDAAHTLRLVDRMLDLRTPESELERMAADLGSDCPFFLRSGPQLGEGRGERLRPVPLDLKGHWLMLLAPGIHVSTPWAFAQVNPTGTALDMHLFQEPPGTWGGRLVNDLEPAVFAMHPELARLKQLLLDQGAAYAAMSGSGSSLFGLFTKQPQRPGLPHGCRCWTFPL